MIGLHVVNDKVVNLASLQGVEHLLLPLGRLTLVGSVQNSNLFVQDDVAVVTHTLGYVVLALKEVDVRVVDTDITNLIR